ncbi:MAG: isoprenoid biosynthesis glyoxalase ElbB [Bacteroidales bacterium]|nr:isoprenoid biosynthesis glyoxalase ElbB [Bacteroidales bacterium]
MKKFALVLAGCGWLDGTEINEAVCLLLALSQHSCEVKCFAPNRLQTHVVNHFAGEQENNEERNILQEAARITRRNIQPIEEFKADDFDALLFSGGYGVAKNLCNYAFKGADMEVQPDVARVILEMHAAKKPIGGMCIAPVMFAKLIPGVCVTLGSDGTSDAANVFKMGGNHVQTEHGDVVADNENLVFTTPAFMLDATLKDIYDGAYNLIDAILVEK